VVSLQKDLSILPMNVVRALTGLSDRQIRYYEEKQLVVPLREKQQRKYSLDEVDRLIEISNMISSGEKIEEIRNKVQKSDDDYREKLRQYQNEFIKIGRLK
jgi:MerR family glutamine synthetase transcriptional repressor